MIEGTLPGPCLLCGSRRGIRSPEGWDCAVCGWRVGAAPDPDLPPPRLAVVYYLRWRERIKIGTSQNPRQRLGRLWHEELLAFEPGGRATERARHERFATLRIGGEWFRSAPELEDHIRSLGAADDPWDDYARWVSAAFRG